MATSKNPSTTMLRDLAALMLSVAAESVGMLKRSAPERALSLKPKDEWGIHLEFLKILFNLADRFSALYVPLKDQPQFMDSLEDTVADQLKTAMAPMLSAGTDPMEIVVTIGQEVGESRRLYEPFKFVVTEDSKEKEACFALLAERVGTAMGEKENGMVTSAAMLCVSAVVPAMQKLFEGTVEADTTAQASSPRGAEDQRTHGNEIKLISVMSSVQGEEVETRWGLHPQFKRDLTSEEARELSKLMNRATQILGERYAAVAFSETWAAWQHPGHA